MNMRSVILFGLSIASYVSADNHGVYSSEFKAFKTAPENQLLLNQERSGGSHTNQCNIDAYRSLVFEDDQSSEFFTTMNLMRQDFALGAIQREIVMAKELSLMGFLLQTGLSGHNSDLIIVTSENMPALYNYVDSISKKSNIATPVVFVSLKKDFFKSFSRKVLMFTGSIVIGQELLQNLSDEELEAVVAQEIGHIKYNHSNKSFLLQAAALGSFMYFVVNKMSSKAKNLDLSTVNLQSVGANLLCNELVKIFVVPALVSLLVSKRFAQQVDLFASEVGKSNGLINFYERLQTRDQLRVEEFDAISDSLQKNAAEMPMLLYAGFCIFYYMAKTEDYVAGIYNKFAYPSHQERIAAAQQYLASQEA